jgi:hypothetical protein
MTDRARTLTSSNRSPALKTQTVLQSFRERFVEPRAEIMAGIFREGASRGEVSDKLDMEVIMDFLHGAFWYRLLLGKQLDDGYARRMVALCTPDSIATQ